MTEIKYTYDFDPFSDELFPPEEMARLASVTQEAFIQSVNTTPVFHELWKEIHWKNNPDAEWWESIRARVRKLVCKCDAFLDEYLESNPIRFEDWPKYSFDLHNVVNEKLKKTSFSWEQYQSKYPQWKKVDGHRIGVASVNYESLGGTETFHQTLAPRLSNVIGFASLNELHGDVTKLGVPCGQGVDAVASLALQSDTVIAWNIDWSGMPRPKRLITVHHGSLVDNASTKLCLQGDSIVCVNREVAEYVKTITDKPVLCIEPAVDPDRIKPRNQVETNGKKICLWSHRFHREKRPQLAIEIAKQLPDDWQMVMTGHRGERLELNDRVTTLPPTHPGDWLSVASCFLSTSLFEGFGLSVAEAITAGVPVVSAPVGIATRPGLALTVPSDAKPEEWAEAIVGASQQVPTNQNLFSVEAFLKQWESVFNTA